MSRNPLHRESHKLHKAGWLRAASSLVVLLVLPLALPVLVFGCLAVSALDAGLSATPHLSLLGALLLLAIVALPPTIAAALRTSLG